LYIERFNLLYSRIIKNKRGKDCYYDKGNKN
jgi:hypothetical protein